MNCPSCHGGMDAVSLQSHIGLMVNIDVCDPCHLIWFDHLESTSLSPGSVIELFKRIHADRNVTRNLVSMQTKCPICVSPLQNTSDLAKGGRFTYSRCANQHGRLIAFTQFLKEKNFIRSLQSHEIASLSVKVKQIRCSSCGGPINLEADSACRHCGSAISVLDEAAVEKALVALQKQDMDRVVPSPERMAEALLAGEERARRARRLAEKDNATWDWQTGNTSGGGLTDLVEMGLGVALAAWLE